MVKKNILLLVGGLYHPFDSGARILKTALEATGHYQVYTSDNRESLLAANLTQFDGVVSYVCAGDLTLEQETGLVEYVHAGGAYIGVHGATTLRGDHPAYDEMLGGRFVSHPPVGEVAVTIVDREHPITQGITDFTITDELYMLDKFDPAQSRILATATHEGQTHPVAYTKACGKGKVFYLALGHDERALEHGDFQKLLRNGIGWALLQ